MGDSQQHESERLNDQPPSPISSAANEKAILPATTHHDSLFTRVFDSFRQDRDQHLRSHSSNDEWRLEDGRVRSYDLNRAINNTAHTPLAKKLKTRHLQMIAIGGAIGMINRSRPPRNMQINL
jgi:amino acid transporter